MSAIIENFDGTFLLHLRDGHAARMKNEWCLIGGSTEDDEAPEKAIEREVLEEMNLHFTRLSLATSWSIRENKRKVFVFHGRVDTRNERVVIGEGRGMCFFTTHEVLNLIQLQEKPNRFLLAFKGFLDARK